jgi:hypothetical protein
MYHKISQKTCSFQCCQITIHLDCHIRQKWRPFGDLSRPQNCKLRLHSRPLYMHNTLLKGHCMKCWNLGLLYCTSFLPRPLITYVHLFLKWTPDTKFSTCGIFVKQLPLGHWYTAFSYMASNLRSNSTKLVALLCQCTAVHVTGCQLWHHCATKFVEYRYYQTHCFLCRNMTWVHSAQGCHWHHFEMLSGVNDTAVTCVVVLMKPLFKYDTDVFWTSYSRGSSGYLWRQYLLKHIRRQIVLNYTSSIIFTHKIWMLMSMPPLWPKSAIS